MQLIASFLIACVSSYCLYELFFCFSSVIWSQDNPQVVDAYIPALRGCIHEHNGLQAYALFLLMFCNLALGGFLYWNFIRIKEKFLRQRLLAVALLVGVFYCITVGIHFPVATPTFLWPWAICVAVVFGISVFFSMNNKAPWLTGAVILTLFIICALTAVSDIGREDYTFILAPASRLLHGFGLKDTFFLYDYFLSIIATVWLKFFPPETVPMLAGIGFFGLFAGAFLLAQKYFYDKKLAIFLLISLVLVKVYIDPMNYFFQATPWRLDWWLPLVALAFWKSSDHWTLGIGIGFLILLHHLFGSIYAACYMIFSTMLFCLDVTSNNMIWQEVLKKHLRRFSCNMLIIISAWILYQVFLAPSLNLVLFYQQNNLGSTPINPQSFYWYMPVICGMAFILLIKNRRQVDAKYFEAGLLLMSLVIGSCMYFFRRSHPNNLIFVAAGLLMVTFFLLDLIGIEVAQGRFLKYKQWVTTGLGFILILVISYQYDYKVMNIFNLQVYNLRHKLFIPPPYPDVVSLDFKGLKEATESSQKIIFISQIDYYLYAQGGYDVPRGYYYSWFFLKDYVDYLNDLLERNYYMVIPRRDIPMNRDIIHLLKFHSGIYTQDFLILSHKQQKLH